MTARRMWLLVGTALAVAVSWAVAIGARHTDRFTPAFGQVGAGLPAGDVANVVAPELMKSDRTLVVLVTSGCQYCIANVQLYRSLAALTARDSHGLRLVFVGLESLAATQRFVAVHDIHADRVLAATDEADQVLATPTILLLNRAGVVQRAWVGEQPGAYGLGVLQAVSDSR